MSIRFEGIARYGEDFALPRDLKEAAMTAERLLSSSREQRELDEIAEIAATLN